MNLLKNKPIMMYLLIYPIVLILITGFVFGSIFSDDILTSYDYYGVTMLICPWQQLLYCQNYYLGVMCSMQITELFILRFHVIRFICQN